MIKHIKASNLLSFGPEGLDIKLHNLNVLIGPNGSGKSNFLELLDLIRATPSSDSLAPIRQGGGISEWIWKGASERSKIFLEILIDSAIGGSTPKWMETQSFRHHLSWYSSQDRFQLSDERVENERPYGTHQDVIFFYRYLNGRPMVNVNNPDRKSRELSRDTVNPEVSILSQRRDPENYPELAYLANAYESIRLYREWSFGRKSKYRNSQPADDRNDRLEQDFSNLGIFLSRLRTFPSVKRSVIAALQDLYEGFSDFEILTTGGTVQIVFTEGDFSIPSTRLSDGTLRYLCLLAILLDPNPPPLICIEEPELGLHPDVIPKIADLLIDASKRTQLVVTTHSDMLIDALSEQPESVLICEKHDGQTQIKRLNRDDLSHWLTDYRLGQLWMRGEIGGTRW
jgi:predicted ATPase